MFDWYVRAWIRKVTKMQENTEATWFRNSEIKYPCEVWERVGIYPTVVCSLAASFRQCRGSETPHSPHPPNRGRQHYPIIHCYKRYIPSPSFSRFISHNTFWRFRFSNVGFCTSLIARKVCEVRGRGWRGSVGSLRGKNSKIYDT
jgi:hypothetical protein